MAITKTVSIVSVNEAGDNYAQRLLYGVVNLSIKRDTVEIFTKEYTACYEIDLALTVDQRLEKWTTDILKQMQCDIDRYVREQALKTNAKLATAVTSIQTNLDITGII